MSLPKVLTDIREMQTLAATLGIDLDTLERLTDENGNSIFSMYQSIQDLRENINELHDRLGDMVVAKQLSSINVGDEFYINESGIPTLFIAVHKNYYSNNTTLAIRKHVLNTSPYNNSELVTAYPSSYIYSHIDSAYTPTISDISLVPIVVPCYYASTGGYIGNSVLRSVFLPSVTELTGQGFRIESLAGSALQSNILEGTQLSYFNTNQSRIATYNGVASSYWCRSLRSTQVAYFMQSTGIASYTTIQNHSYRRPLVNISNDSYVYTRTNTVTNVLATATISE